jgi:DNA-binding MarR family transcriptional regulator
MDHSFSDCSRSHASRTLPTPSDGANGLRDRGTVMDTADAGDSDRSSVAPSSGEIANQLRLLRAQIDRFLSDTPHTVRVSCPSPGLTEGLVAARRAVLAIATRDKHFRPGLFVDPEWRMLLDLYIARILEREISVSSLAIASQIPATTALRHIADLEKHGEIRRLADPSDKRRCFVIISDSAFNRMTHCLLQIQSL